MVFIKLLSGRKKTCLEMPEISGHSKTTLILLYPRLCSAFRTPPLFLSGMNLAEILTSERIVPNLASEEQLPAITELVDRLVAVGSLTPEQRDPALTALKEREEQRSTGIGGGIAIPHSFLPNLDGVVAIFGRSIPGIDFCALDRAPVHFIVLFLVPEKEHNLHLKTLSSIAKIMNSADTRNRLAEAGTETEILDILTNRQVA